MMWPKVSTEQHRSKLAYAFGREFRKLRRRAVAEGIVDFAQRKRMLVAGTSARPGPYRYSVTPYLREIAESISEYTSITECVVMKGTQTGGTEGVMMNHQLYCMEYGIGPVLYVTSDDDLAQEFMEKRVDPMIASAGMQDVITPPVQKRGGKGTGDSQRAKSFRGTFLRAIGARSESKLSSFPIRVLHADEIDKYPGSLVGGGSSIEKAIRRTDSYRNLKKIIYISTPKEKATSRIEPLFEQGDMRFYYVPCPKCGTMQPLKWSNIKWNKGEDGKVLLEFDDDGHLLNNPVWHECANEDCKYKMRDYEKVNFQREKGYGGEAEWRPSKKPDRPGIRSYHISGLYGFRSWLDIVMQWERIEGDQILLQDFVNDVLGETWEAKIDKPDEHYLMSRAETDWNRGDVHVAARILTMGVDVQADRIEAQLTGFGRGRESWVVDYFVFEGNPNEPHDKCWDNLENAITADYPNEDGEVRKIQTVFIDAPYANPAVMSFCERFAGSYSPRSFKGVFPAFGKQTLSAIVKEHGSTIAVPEILVDDQRLKFEIYSNLKRKVPAAGHKYPAGFVHFPHDLSEEYYKQLTAEEVIETVNNKGVASVHIANTKQRRNEVLDTFKLSLGALYYIYLKFFEIWNGQRKLRKLPLVKAEWNLFWDSIEGN